MSAGRDRFDHGEEPGDGMKSLPGEDTGCNDRIAEVEGKGGVTTIRVPGEDNMHKNEWQCDYLRCGRVFQKRHDLNRHKKYHLKPFKCSAPACAIRNIAFSLAKDLLRHQKGHESERYFCPRAGCVSAAGGLFAGFARVDNWRRHLRRHLEGEHT